MNNRMIAWAAEQEWVWLTNVVALGPIGHRRVGEFPLKRSQRTLSSLLCSTAALPGAHPSLKSLFAAARPINLSVPYVRARVARPTCHCNGWRRVPLTA